jgi:hypothetical protein
MCYNRQSSALQTADHVNHHDIKMRFKPTDID